MKIPFTKAHGAQNDFLLTWEAAAPREDLAEVARAICHRHTGVGADGWLLVSPPAGPEADGAIRLYNSDGSVAEISGNGTRGGSHPHGSGAQTPAAAGAEGTGVPV